MKLLFITYFLELLKDCLLTIHRDALCCYDLPPAMKVLVTTIPFTGIKIEAPISKEALNTRLAEGLQYDQVTFDEAPTANLTLTRIHGGVVVNGVISGICRQGCATCADQVPNELNAQISWVLQTSSDRAGSDDTLEDPGVIIYEGEHIDLEEPLQEALILNISPFWHPARDPKELCLLCKRDCSKSSWKSTDDSGAQQPSPSSSFGALLKGAIGKNKG